MCGHNWGRKKKTQITVTGDYGAGLTATKYHPSEKMVTVYCLIKIITLIKIVAQSLPNYTIIFVTRIGGKLQYQ